MKNIFHIAASVMVVFSSCAKENVMTDNSGVSVFTASMEAGDTKVKLDGKTPSWEVGDIISIDGHEYKATSAGTSHVTFSGKGATETSHHAYFPKEMYDNGSLTIPASVTETWANGKFNMPMYAVSTTESLSFKNLCGVLKITVKNDQMASVKSIKISSLIKAVSGAFTISNDTAVLTEASAATNTFTVSYTKAVSTDAAGTVFYVSVPAQTYRELKIEISDGTNSKSMTTASGLDVVVERNRIYPISFYVRPNGALSGRFSVSADKQVHFSKGNLWAKAYDDYWNFESAQYLFNEKYEYDHISLFYWSKYGSKAKLRDFDDYEVCGAGDILFTNKDMTTPNPDFVVNGVAGKFRVLSSEEWTYLFKSRTNADKLYKGGVAVCGHEGCLIIAPDGYTGTIQSSYDRDSWTAAEATGLVCLPEADGRSGYEIIGYGGCYWASHTLDYNSAYQIAFNEDGNVSSEGWYNFRCYGVAIRLVTDAQ